MEVVKLPFGAKEHVVENDRLGECRVQGVGTNADVSFAGLLRNH